MDPLNTTCPSPAENPHIFDLSSSYGAILIGSSISSAFWGVSSLQTFTYYVNYEADPLWTKIMIAVLWIINTINEMLVIKSNWPVMVLQYGRVSGFSDMQPELMHHIWVQAVVIFTVQIFFIRRIYLFYKVSESSARNWSKVMITFLVVLIILALWQLVAMFAYVILGYGHRLDFLFTKRQVVIGLSVRASAIAVDVVIAICMICLLNQQGPMHFTRSRQMIRRLLFVIISSGSLTAVIVTMVLVLLARYPHELYYTIFEFTLCSLYFSTLLSSLNSRDYVKAEKGGTRALSVFNSTPDVGLNSNKLLLGRMGKKSCSKAANSEMFIKVQTDTEVRMDDIEAFSPTKGESR